MKDVHRKGRAVVSWKMNFPRTAKDLQRIFLFRGPFSIRVAWNSLQQGMSFPKFRVVAFQKGCKDMEQPEIKIILTKMVRVILRGQPGFVPLGNVWMEWDGQRLSWDIPHQEWDVDAVCASLVRQAAHHPEIEYIANIAEGFSHL